MNKKDKKPNKKVTKNNFVKNFLIYIFVFLAIGVLLSFNSLDAQKDTKVGMKDFVDFINDGNVKELLFLEIKLILLQIMMKKNIFIKKNKKV